MTSDLFGKQVADYCESHQSHLWLREEISETQKKVFLSLTIIEKSCKCCQLICYCIIRLCHWQRVFASNFFCFRYCLCTYCSDVSSMDEFT